MAHRTLFSSANLVKKSPVLTLQQHNAMSRVSLAGSTLVLICCVFLAGINAENANPESFQVFDPEKVWGLDGYSDLAANTLL